MKLSDIEVGTSYAIDHDEDNEMWLVIKVISRTESSVTFMELALAGSCAGQASEAQFNAFPGGGIGGRLLGKAGQ